MIAFLDRSRAGPSTGEPDIVFLRPITSRTRPEPVSLRPKDGVDDFLFIAAHPGSQTPPNRREGRAAVAANGVTERAARCATRCLFVSPGPCSLFTCPPFFSLPRCVWLRLVLALSLCRADVQYGSTVVAPELCCATGWPCCCTVQQLQLDPCGFRSLPSRAEKGRDVNCKATLPSARALPCLSLLVTNTTKRWDRCWSLVGHSSVPRLQRSPAPQLVLSAQPSTRQLALPDQPGRSFEYAPLVTPERPLVVCPSSPPRGSL